jgi:aarF domain-containing kinase
VACPAALLLCSSRADSILNECLPYISQRVLTDASPRARSALQTFVFESTDEAAACASSDGALAAAHAPAPVLDAPRLAKLADGFKSFSASAGGLSLDAEEQLQRLAGQLVDLLLAREGSPLQDLVLDEAARLADASVRDLVDMASRVPPPALTPVLSRVIDPLGLLASAQPLLNKYHEDERVLAAAATLSAPLLEALPSTSDAWAQLLDAEDSQGKLVRFVASKLWDRRQDMPLLSARLAGKVLVRGLDRIEQITATTDGADGGQQASRALAATLLTGGLATLSTGLVAVAPESQRGVVTPANRGGAAPAPQPTTTSV